jgi:hypothetical protein
MYAIGALGAMYLGGVAMENQAKIAKEMVPTAGYRNVHIYTQDNKQDYVHLRRISGEKMPNGNMPYWNREPTT